MRPTTNLIKEAIMRPRVLMLSRLDHPAPEPVPSLADYPLHYEQLETESRQRIMWRRVSKGLIRRVRL